MLGPPGFFTFARVSRVMVCSWRVNLAIAVKHGERRWGAVDRCSVEEVLYREITTEVTRTLHGACGSAYF